MTDEELTKLEALSSAATPGPWSEFCESGDWWVSQKDEFDGPHAWVFNSNTDFWNKQEDVDLVVAARNALPALIAEVRRLRATKQELIDAVQWCDSFYKDVWSTTPEYFELCGDLNATQYLHSEAMAVRERAVALSEAKQ